MTKTIGSFNCLSYEVKLKRLELFSLGMRQIIEYITKVCRVMNSIRKVI